MMKNRSRRFFRDLVLLIVLVLVLALECSAAFTITTNPIHLSGGLHVHGAGAPNPKPIRPLFLRGNDNNNDDNDDGDSLSSPSSIDENLQRPPINIRKESILFSDNPATAQNNNIARLWKFFKNRLPYVFTGVSKDSADKRSAVVDKNPVGAIYNMVFVRCPSVLAGVVYSKNLIEGHPLYCDVGFGTAGPFEIPPLFVYGILLIILR